MAGRISVLTPLLYVATMVTALVVFSSVYRRRRLAALSQTKPWYPDNYARELYYSLKASPDKVPEKLLKAALIRWAAEDIRQMLRMRDTKQVLATLHEKGSVGDQVWNRFNTSEKLVQLEMNELVEEANAIKPGWAQMLMQTATEVAQNEGLRKRLGDFANQNQGYREEYEKIKKEAIAELEA